ncbi:MAG: hypothetical protein KF764_26900 [Labilithrix sp.]|nr:hypothetical protein [Labilithrix sp.]
MRPEVRRAVGAKRLARAVVALLGLASPAVASAEGPPRETPAREPYVFVADPKLGVETSVRTIDSLGRIAFRYEDSLPSFGIDERRFSGKVLGWLGRGLELVFLDEPIAEITSLVSHEAGGHGARARELGLRPTYLFYLPGIYRRLFSATEDERAGAFTSYRTTGLIEEPQSTIGTLGGLEANYVQAWWQNARIVRAGGWVHHGDLLVYGASKLPYADSFLSSSIEVRGSTSANDVESYVTGLQELSNGWRPEDRRRIARRLRAGYAWNLADPTLLYAIYGTVVSRLALGERRSRMPLPEIGGVTMLLSPRFGLTPFGGEQALDVFLADRRGQMLDVYARVGTSGLASYYGAGARALGVRAGSRVALGGELDVWRQPEILLDRRAVFDPPSRVGVNAGLYGDVWLTKELALTGKLAVKTPGYVSGLPISGGPHGYLGVSVAWP